MKKLSLNLKKSEAEALAQFPLLRDGNDVAKFLEIPYGQLLHLAYRIPDAGRYKEFLIPKRSGGERNISSPISGIGILQAKLKPVLEGIYRPKKSAHGFIKNRSILTNADSHVRSRYVLNIDLEDFFGTIHFGRVRGMLMAKPFGLGAKAAAIVAQLLTHKGTLPQGACTSPVVSNIISATLDKKLIHLAQRYNMTYTRYADDITFSTKKKSFPEAMLQFEGSNPFLGNIKVGPSLQSAVTDSGFVVNAKKVRLQTRGVRQEVTGLTVNEFTNVPRKFIRQIRAMINAWRKYGLINSEIEYLAKWKRRGSGPGSPTQDGTYFRNVIYGKLAYLKMIRGGADSVLSNLASQIATLDKSPPKYISEIMMKSELYDVFICHASEDKDTVARPLWEACKRLSIKAFLDEKGLVWGDSLTEKINAALGKSRFFIAIMSDASINKSWPKKEVQSAIARDIAGQQKFLPLILGDPDIILKEFPLLADRLYLKWTGDPDEVARKLRDLKA